jgi:hypothetical protein
VSADLTRDELSGDALAAVGLADVLRAVAGIRADWEATDNDEDAHLRESLLHRNILRAAAAGHPSGALLAWAALGTERIGFPRRFG